MSAHIAIRGAGVAGLWCALELARAGAKVDVFERSAHLGECACSWMAGGMLAADCESEEAPQSVIALARGAIESWSSVTPVEQSGTLVLSQPRDRAELARMSRRTSNHRRVGAAEISELEPELAHFREGLWFAEEGHIEPRRALGDLLRHCEELGVHLHFGCERIPSREASFDRIVDCRGIAASDALASLRAVRGEMLVLKSSDVSLRRPVRLLHPRFPLYVVPRAGGHFMLGATMLESDDTRSITLRSAVELMQAAYSLHPAFAEAELVETGSQLRPAFPDNAPRIEERGETVFVNGLYRHGFLLAPGLAKHLRTLLLPGSRQAGAPAMEARV